MRPELFKIPFTEITVKSYGVMLVIGFLFAVYLMRSLARRCRQDPEQVTNVALYALISGVIGCRLFYVFHNWDQFRNNLWDIFAVWQGGLEFLGGVILAIVVIVVYHRMTKFPARIYMDLLAIGLMLGLGFGRIGCLLNGCCFGKPADVPWAIRFPYGSHPYESQAYPDFSRNRAHAHIDLPEEFYGYFDEQGNWQQVEPDRKYFGRLKPYEDLTDEQKKQVNRGVYRCKPVHPTQVYSSINAFILCGILYLFWKKFGRYRPGTTFSLMFILYGLTRFGIEFIRAGNPYESGWWTITDRLTISQNLGIYLAILGAVLMAIFLTRKRVPLPDAPEQPIEKPEQPESEPKQPDASEKEPAKSPKETVQRARNLLNKAKKKGKKES